MSQLEALVLKLILLLLAKYIQYIDWNELKYFNILIEISHFLWVVLISQHFITSLQNAFFNTQVNNLHLLITLLMNNISFFRWQLHYKSNWKIQFSGRMRIWTAKYGTMGNGWINFQCPHFYHKHIMYETIVKICFHLKLGYYTSAESWSL